MDREALRRDLATISEKRILFGHQSVGGNILDGLRSMMRAQQGSSLTLISAAEIASHTGGFFAEALVGENTDPSSKCAGFSALLDSAAVQRLDAALMKFCYVDITAQTDVRQVFTLYQQTITALAARHPQLTFVHSTVPLMQVTPWWKRIAKQVLGRPENSVRDNLRREEFNTLLRRASPAETIFDLAAVESTHPDGTREQFEVDGQRGYALVPGYTDDGGHLNETGSVRAARELVRVLSARLSGPKP